MHNITIFKVTEIIFFAVLLLKLRRDLKMGPRVFLWTILGYGLLAIIIVAGYLNINFEYWQIQTIFLVVVILLVTIGYKFEKAKKGL